MLQEIRIEDSGYSYGSGELRVDEVTADNIIAVIQREWGLGILYDALLKDSIFLKRIKKEYKIDIEHNIKLNKGIEFTKKDILVLVDDRYSTYQNLDTWLDYGNKTKMPKLYAEIDSKILKDLYPTQYKRMKETIEANKIKNEEKAKKKEQKKLEDAKKTLKKAGLIKE